ncbi:hypothetical protein B0T26DRAFT_713689 [Lasiosphaeria miniovina]|uniref:Uncharacterized protein n=1 Tax=Lasiosphaeria miniovina TaxID=1954250 RepID=A0AA40DYQ3_9PEZI|nr:uncharacterized protein B0T26DRAFT_713689 [Lasiosphaeria miniovina]KAK0718597.1 hypothetical protein B0T26DRAFT_713689 [Lasiosphaeria miniovina]
MVLCVDSWSSVSRPSGHTRWPASNQCLPVLGSTVLLSSSVERTKHDAESCHRSIVQCISLSKRLYLSASAVELLMPTPRSKKAPYSLHWTSHPLALLCPSIASHFTVTPYTKTMHTFNRLPPAHRVATPPLEGKAGLGGGSKATDQVLAQLGEDDAGGDRGHEDADLIHERGDKEGEDKADNKDHNKDLELVASNVEVVDVQQTNAVKEPGEYETDTGNASPAKVALVLDGRDADVGSHAADEEGDSRHLGGVGHLGGRDGGRI